MSIKIIEIILQKAQYRDLDRLNFLVLLERMIRLGALMKRF